ncbi:restriction endonuclease subunit S [Chitiniphilus eburneus]|uniref:restriction endonuclease subunit S n=1 Tax=Chitiniphilus eburneus TaxID=2571148 RepID=UPI001B7FE5E4|nr:restriction endonuclease subunit S [Chitiniphilus eburneus]
MSDNKNLKPGWKVWRFDQIAINVNVRIDNPSESGMEHYVGLEHLDADSLKIRRWGTPDDVEATKLMFKKGDIIFARRRAYQRKLGVAEFDGICSAHAMVLRAKPEVVLPEFLPFFMQSNLFMNRAVEISVGSLSPTINWKTMAAQEFALPSMDEQISLATAFSSIDELLHELDSAQRELAIAERSAIQSVLGEDDKWLMATMKSVVKSIEAGKSPKASSLPAEPHELGVLKVSAVGSQGYCPEENKALLNPNDFIPEATVEIGDFLVTRANAQPQGVARTCIVESTPNNLMLCDKTWRLRFTADAPPKQFILAWTKLPKFRSYIEALCSGTEAKNISQEKFLAAPMVHLDKGQQEDIGRAMEEIERAKKALEKRRGAVLSFKRSFLNKAFGED